MNALTPISGSDPTPRKVLIVDDAATIRRYHRMIVEEAGFEVDEAFNGVEALEKGMTGEFGAFLVDVNMPEMNGYEFLAELRKQADIAGTPVVMISTEAEALDAEKAMAIGANFYFVKPARPENLSECLHLLMPGGAT
jgi:two-component system chemotaxis response regulator CheY